MSREKVLSLLREHPDQSLSGEAMSRQLGVSRAAVWKAIEALRQEGYVISSAPNRGYCLQSAPDRVREGPQKFSVVQNITETLRSKTNLLCYK